MTRILGRYSLHIDDLLRTSRLSEWRAAGQFILSRLWGGREQRLNAAASYLMYRPDGAIASRALADARRDALGAVKRQDGGDLAPIARSAVIKPCVSGNEPGILLVSFEKELRKLLASPNFDRLQQDYRICFMPTWQNFFSAEIMELDARATQPYYLLPSDFGEARLGPLLGTQARILPFHAASWVDHGLYCRSPVEKDTDIIMLANFHRFKRHWKLFEALSTMPQGIKVVLMGVPLHGRTKADLLREAGQFGVADRVEIIENSNDDRPGDQDALRNFLERARLMCALSNREGSYVGVAEALMANTPVAMFSNAMVGTKAYINPETGFLLDPARPLGTQLLHALEVAPTLRPRDWMVPNASAQTNCHKLNVQIKQDYLAGGRDWSVDIPRFHCVRFEIFLDGAASTSGGIFAEEYARLERDFGIRFKRPT